jgi:lysophospholipase L1-like esterase
MVSAGDQVIAVTTTGPPPARPALRLSLKKKVLFALVTVLGMPLALIVAAEAGARVYVHFRYGQPGKSYGIYMADDELGATQRPNSYNSNSVINNWGLRDTQDVSPDKPADSMRVYCSGGSTTYCYNLNTEDAWPSVLERKLRQVPGHEHDQVLNAGQICFSLAHEFALAKRLIPRLKPDVVVLFTGFNELMAAQIIEGQDGGNLDQLLAEGRFGVCARHLDQARFLKRNSVLVRLWDYKAKKLFEGQATAAYREAAAAPMPLHPWVVANFDHTLREYLAFLKAHHCRVVVLRYGDNGKENWHLVHCIRMLRDRAVAIGREQGAEVCDIVPLVDRNPHRQDLFIASGVHVTSAGAELVAEELKKTLVGKTRQVVDGR